MIHKVKGYARHASTTGRIHAAKNTHREKTGTNPVKSWGANHPGFHGWTLTSGGASGPGAFAAITERRHLAIKSIDNVVSTRCLVISGAGKAGPDVWWDMSVGMGISGGRRQRNWDSPASTHEGSVANTSPPTSSEAVAVSLAKASAVGPGPRTEPQGHR